MTKSCTWQAPLVTRRFKSPTGPLADVDPGMCLDYTRQRPIHPTVVGSQRKGFTTMNSSGTAAQADVTSLDTNGTASPFPAPFMR